MKQILFSCVGTSDPVRGEHDGPMLHILRHYRPTRAVLFFTPEIEALAAKDGRFEKTERWIWDHWGGYRPCFQHIRSSVTHAHDLDALDRPLHEAVALLSRENPDAEILINVSSGTPQMQMILSQLVMDTRYRARGIQVSNFENRSGRAQRTNDRAYDVELELECNEDELPEAENRCVEPEMYAIRREYLRRQIWVLLDKRNFEAVEQLSDSLPEELGHLARHLAARSRLQGTEALRRARELKQLPFRLYSYKSGSRGEYSQVCEYYLLMKNLVRAGNYTEFLLHMEPLTLTLQLALLDRLLLRHDCRIDAFFPREKGRRFFVPEKLQTALPELFRHYVARAQARHWELVRREPSTILCDELLSWFPALPEKAKQLFSHYDLLKDLRNQLAHTLSTVTEAEVKAACQVGTAKLLEEIEGTIISCYPVCDPVIFSVYDKSIDYIKHNL